jgi:hypothetical protein
MASEENKQETKQIWIEMRQRNMFLPGSDQVDNGCEQDASDRLIIGRKKSLAETQRRSAIDHSPNSKA